MPIVNPIAATMALAAAIGKFHVDNGVSKACLDVSGGIDSAVMAGLLVLALGSDAVVFDHSIFKTNPTQTGRAQRIIQAVGGRLCIVDLTDDYNRLVGAIETAMIASGASTREEIDARTSADRTIYGSVRSTLRAPIGRAFNRLFGGGIRHGTGNEDEDRFIRFYQKGGDGEVDTNPISAFSKGEVYQIAHALGTIFERTNPDAPAAFREIIEATPSPDLWGEGDAHSDEAELFAQYKVRFTYSRINPITGEYSYVGTIERIARFLDLPEDQAACGRPTTLNDQLFAPDISEGQLDNLVFRAMATPYFQGFSFNSIRMLLAAARRAERITRHKLNPAIPSIMTRTSFAEFLTNDLPAV